MPTASLKPKFRWITPLLVVLTLIAIAILGYRLVFGLGAVTNLSNQFPWGLWLVLDVIIGSAIACGGLAVSVMIVVLNKSEYRPLLRPALLTSLFGYSLAGVSALFDMGRYWQVINLFDPAYQNWNSVILEVSLCISAYCLILLIELSPPWFRRLGWPAIERQLNRLMFILLPLGLLLACLHQASLGSLLLLVDQRIMPLWQSAELLPVLTLLTALMTGGAIVVLESQRHFSPGRSAVAIINLQHQLAQAATRLGLLFIGLRIAELIWTNKLPLLLTQPGYGSLLVAELTLFGLPALILWRKADKHRLLITMVTLLLANVGYRFNAFLFAFAPDITVRYYPSLAECLVSLGLIAFELLLFRQLVPCQSGRDNLKHSAATN